MRFRQLFVTGAVVAATLGFMSPAEANHSWGGYHWARTANSFTLKLGDNVSTSWDSYLSKASSDWTISTVLDTSVVGGSTKPRLCTGKSGTVQVCNAAYGNNGWLGLASIWIAGGTHITQGTVKLNDTYFNTAAYNTPAWRAFVTCQEIGHTFGLAHQDENFTNANLGTCMDYTNDPSTNMHPNTHDFDELVTTYSHLDSTTTVAALSSAGSASPSDQGGVDRGPAGAPGEWGRLVSGSESPRHVAVYERDFGGGDKEVRFVIWA